MTGFGRAEMLKGEHTIIVEIKSLNGKQLEMNLRISPMLKPYEFDIRNLLQQSLQRGSLEMSITLKYQGSSRPVNINVELAQQYYQTLRKLSSDLQLSMNDMLGTLMKLPEVVTPAMDILPEEEWLEVREVILVAIEDLDAHRSDEGEALEGDLILRIGHIQEHLDEVKLQDPGRIQRMKLRLENQLQEYVGKENVDANRLEQEMIYYIEKLDISEEEMRLANHCRYFRDVLVEPEAAKGKKLNFILQEIGREINTIGSKANDSQIQQQVVRMKDELEKAKEQVLNVL